MRIALVAEPWWVNLAILVPVAAYFFWRRSSLPVTASQLIIVALFASAFGFVEATVVVYLRAASGLLPGYQDACKDAYLSRAGATADCKLNLRPMPMVRANHCRATPRTAGESRSWCRDGAGAFSAGGKAAEELRVWDGIGGAA